MNQHNVVAKLNQIVEQAQLTLQDPKGLTSERQRLTPSVAGVDAAGRKRRSSRGTSAGRAERRPGGST